jgi:glycosyltransferase involved in cell wall biosynthesis
VSRTASSPRISINIPTKNSSGTLERCLRSVLSQQLPLEIIVADDCSVDGTQQIARSLGARVLEGPLPLLEARYQAFLASTADCILMLDGDQFLEPTTLERCINELAAYDALVLEERSARPTTWLAKLFDADRRLLMDLQKHHLDPLKGSLLPRAFRQGVLDQAFRLIPSPVRQIAVAQDHAIIYEAVGRFTTSVGLIPDAITHEEMDSLADFWRKYFRWGAGLVTLFSLDARYRQLTTASLRGRLYRGDAPVKDYAMSLMLLGLKLPPYALGYAYGSLSRRRAGAPPPTHRLNA